MRLVTKSLLNIGENNLVTTKIYFGDHLFSTFAKLMIPYGNWLN